MLRMILAFQVIFQLFKQYIFFWIFVFLPNQKNVVSSGINNTINKCLEEYFLMKT